VRGSSGHKKLITIALKPFHFKQFDIHHDKCAMKVGTDGVLLGAWCKITGAESVLDIGTGSGLIAIMQAQRNSKCCIDAIEIDFESYRQARNNADNCPWKSRISVHHTSFQDYWMQCNKKYDMIVSNPPYFQNSLLNPSAERSAARHSFSLSMEDLIEGVTNLLNPDGSYCMIMPVPEAMLFIGKAEVKKLFCRKITFVMPNPGKSPKRLLMEFKLIQGDVKKSDLVIEIGKRHEYSEEFKALTKDFYLYFLH
jgi:tRNA1Val (adenine37-N6)-methyltransferase